MPHPKQSDIAAMLKVSRVTVTKALNDDPDIAVETKRRIREAASQLGYIPNRVGRQLATNQTMTLGLIVPKIAHSFFAEAIESMYEAALSHGFDLIPMVTFEDAQREERSLQTLLSMRVDGLIVDCTAQSHISRFSRGVSSMGLPLTFFDRMPRGQTDFSSVTCDNQLVVAELMKLVREKGYSRVAHLAGYDTVNIGQERRQGFELACRILGLELTDERIVTGGFREADGYAGMNRLLSLPTPPDFVFAVNDTVAHGAYKALQEAGLRVPDEVAVAGFGDIESSRLLLPALTSIQIPIRRMAMKTVELLVRQIQHPSEPITQDVMASTLIVRHSV
jgi:LacI family transcriptional regulator